MTNATHTQGPWATYVDSAHDGWIADAEGNLIACAVRNENMQANARLIAAAPELLAALDEYIDEFEGDLTHYNPRYQRALAAITKVKGA